MIKHKLKLNDDKTEFITISSPHNKNEINGLKIKIGEESIVSSTSVRNLGVIMDCFYARSHNVSLPVLLISFEKYWFCPSISY